MTTNIILTQHEQITKWVLPIDATTDLTGQPDNVYPFNGAPDQWAVVMDERQIAWAAEYGTACIIFIIALQTKREHAQRCPADTIPFDGQAPATAEWADDYGLSEATL